MNYRIVPVTMDEKELEATFVTVTPLEESDRRKTWGNDVTRKKGRSWSWSWTWGFRLGWSSACKTTKKIANYVLEPLGTIKVPLNATREFLCGDYPVAMLWSSKKQWLGHFLLLAGGILPMAILGYFTPGEGRAIGTSWFRGVFNEKVLWCGNSYLGTPQNSIIRGIEGLFVLDSTWGQFSFSRAKTIDVAWDILVGRGVQIAAWWVAYTVFSDALLRVIERHPASFEIFQRMALEGPSLHSLWTLCKELWTMRSKRTRFLFGFMFWATAYVLCIPMFLGAMTGYDSKTSAWIDPDGSQNLIPTDALKIGWVITGNGSIPFDKVKCANTANQPLYDFSHQYRDQVRGCDCKFPNGEVLPADPKYYDNYYGASPIVPEYRSSCRFDFPGAVKTYNVSSLSGPDRIQNCNDTMKIEFEGITYDAQGLNATNGWCYGSTGWNNRDIYDKSRCLPDTANPTYEWGFSSMLSGIFVIIHCIWSVSMYLVWQNAQFRSALVQSGYNMTPLRAAFAIAKVAKHKTGLGERQLVRAATKDLEKELYGHRGTKGSKVDYDLFVGSIEDEEDEDRMTTRRRSALGRDGLGSQQTLASPDLRFDEN